MKDARSTPVTKEMAASIAGHAGQTKIVMAGAFPPPIYGMAVVNAAVRDALRQAGVTATVIDLATPSLDRSIAARLGLGRLARQSTLRGETCTWMFRAGGLIREYLPKGMRLSLTSQSYLNTIARQLNNRPHRCLDYETHPRSSHVKSVTQQAVFHFKHETAPDFSSR